MYSSGRLFTGVLILLIGVLLLLSNTGVLGWGLWLNLISLWPLLIIAIGLRLIFPKGPLAVLSPLVLVLMVVLAVFNPVGYYHSGSDDSSFRQVLEPGVSEAALIVDTGALDLNVSGGKISGSDIVGGARAGDLVNVSEQWVGRPTVWTYTVSGDKATIHGKRSLSRIMAIPFGSKRWENKTSITLNESIPWTIELNCGASNIDLDLSSIEVKRLDINSGASNIEIVLGDKASYTEVDIDAGFVAVELTVPRDVGILIEEKFALSGDNLGSLGFEREGDVWLSPGYSQTSKRIRISMDGGFSSFNIRYSGSSRT